MKKLLVGAISAGVVALSLSSPAFAASDKPPAVEAGEVNLYSARKEQLIKPVLDKFTEETGIKVNLITGKSDALIKRVALEGESSPADLLITVDAGRLHRAKEEGVLQAAITPDMQNRVPENYRDADNKWVALSMRARVIIYDVNDVKPEELSTYEALTDAKWKNRICIRSSTNIYNQSMVASMISHKGAEATEQWAKGMVNNFARKPTGGDTDQIKAVAAGQCDIAIANTYYLGRLANSSNAEDNKIASKVALFWPNQEDRGTHINVSGIGVTAHAKNKENALKLINFLLSDKVQAWYAEVNNEYPVVAGVELNEVLESWGPFKSDAINLSKLGELNTEAVKVMDRAGWR